MINWTPLQKVIYYDKYARYNAKKHRRETWEESIERVVKFLEKNFTEITGRDLLQSEWDELKAALVSQDILCSMRILQMAGPALERCNVGAYNCAYLTLLGPESLAELLYILMQGTGVGFSVEKEVINHWPEVRTPSGTFVKHHVIEDTTDAWCDALLLGIRTWLEGNDISFDYSKIRRAGAKLHTKGGRASGPGPLRELLTFTRKTIQNRAGQKLRPIDIHDIACYCGQIVQVGGVRRAALISLSSIDDMEMRDCKKGEFWKTHPYRMMANNSAVYDTILDFDHFFSSEFAALKHSGTGERGIFNRGGLATQLPLGRLHYRFMGINPCGEIILRPQEFCNLTAAVCRSHDTEATLVRKIQLAAKLGVIQSTLTRFQYISPTWEKNCYEERLLGVDITGQFDNIELFNNNSSLAMYRAAARLTANDFAERIGLSRPKAVTCIKPSGNSSQLINSSSGLHPRFAPYYIRRLRLGASSTLTKFLIANNVPHHPEIGQDPNNPSVWVFDFPVESPGNNPTRTDVTALDQLDHWLRIKKFYTDHNPSCTIYVRDHEWDDVEKWIQTNFDNIGGLSFLPYDGGHYLLAPYEEITREQYITLINAFPTLDFDAFLNADRKDETTTLGELACTGDSCEL